MSADNEILLENIQRVKTLISSLESKAEKIAYTFEEEIVSHGAMDAINLEMSEKVAELFRQINGDTEVETIPA
jgi:hypothetical protein